MRLQPIHKPFRGFIHYQRHRPVYANQKLDEMPVMWWAFGVKTQLNPRNAFLVWHWGRFESYGMPIDFWVWKFFYKPWKNHCSYTEYSNYKNLLRNHKTNRKCGKEKT